MAESKEKQFHYGGQAVIEGVMMRGPKDFAVAVRRADGGIETTREDIDSIIGRFKWLDRPFLRGTLALIDAMALGIKALKYSADVAMADAAPPAADAEASEGDAPAKSKVNDITVGVMMVVGLVFGLALFFFVPILIIKPLRHAVPSGWELTTLEGLVKITLFVGYVLAISMLRDIRRVFQYHGAEHKTINAYEAGVELTPDNVSTYTKAHVRCGTSFILVVLVTSIVVFALVADRLPHGSLAEGTKISYLMRWLYKLALLPFVAGIAYEVIRLAGKCKDSLFARALVFPGLVMQKITTREPEPEMIEVAIKSLQSVLDSEAVRAADSRPPAPDPQE